MYKGHIQKKLFLQTQTKKKKKTMDIYIAALGPNTGQLGMQNPEALHSCQSSWSKKAAITISKVSK